MNADQVKQNIAEWLHPVKPIQENNYTSQNEDQILNNLYTQSKKRFFYCIGALLAFTILGCAIFTVSIGCLSTVNREPEDSEWIQIVTGVALLVFVTPLAFSVLFVVPHFFITVVKLDKNGIYLPKRLLLLRQYVSYNDIQSAYVEPSGAIFIRTNAGKSYQLPEQLLGVSQILWFLSQQNKNISADVYIKRRVEQWASGKGSAEGDALLGV